MPDEYTPTDESVRSKFATVLDDTAGWKFSQEWAGDFDRWLAEVRREIADAVDVELREWDCTTETRSAVREVITGDNREDV